MRNVPIRSICRNRDRASVYVDQYTGEVKGRHERAPFFLTMFKLHRWLLDGMKPDGGYFGAMIVGGQYAVFVFVLYRVIVICGPRTKKAAGTTSLKIAVGKGRRRFWYDLHVAGGMYALVLLLAMALTGLTWSFSWYRAGFYKVFGVEMKQRAGHGALQTAHGTPQTVHGTPQTAHGTLQTAHGTPQTAHGGKSGRNSSEEGRGNREHTSPYACWQQVYEELKAHNAGYKQITVSNGSASVSFERFGNQRAADRYAFNPQDGEITEVTLYKDTDASGKMRGWIYSVHVGSWGGMFTRILTFIAALLGGTLPLTGYYLWLRRIRLI